MGAKQFTRTFAVVLAARIAAGIIAAIFGALGWYNDWGAYMLTWAHYVTPEIARRVFWAGSVILFCVVLLPYFMALRRRVTWVERNQLELSAIACLSVGKSADEPIDVEPQLSRHRSLTDAVKSGALKSLSVTGEEPSAHTQVLREDLRAYAKSINNGDLLKLLKTWDRQNPPRKGTQIAGAVWLRPNTVPGLTSLRHAPTSEPTVAFSYHDDDIIYPHRPDIDGSVDRFIVPIGIFPSVRIRKASPCLLSFSKAGIGREMEYDFETVQHRASPIKIGWFNEQVYEPRDVFVTGDKFILFEIYDKGTRLALWTNHNLGELNHLKERIPPGEYDIIAAVIHDEMSGSPPSQKLRMKWGGTRETFTMSKVDERE